MYEKGPQQASTVVSVSTLKLLLKYVVWKPDASSVYRNSVLSD
jgi:hypothetical protein